MIYRVRVVAVLLMTKPTNTEIVYIIASILTVVGFFCMGFIIWLFARWCNDLYNREVNPVTIDDL